MTGSFQSRRTPCSTAWQKLNGAYTTTQAGFSSRAARCPRSRAESADAQRGIGRAGYTACVSDTEPFLLPGDEATLEALLVAYPKRTLYGLRDGRLVGPLDADSARTLAREVAESIEGVR